MDSTDHTAATPELTSQIVTIVTTEHYTLQMGRSIAMTEINGRASLFVGAVSSAVVALAFVGQISRLGAVFFLFSLAIIPTLVLMGLITFERVLQASNAEFKYTRGINRLRHLYLQHVPSLRAYFVLSSHDDTQSAIADIGVRRVAWWQGLFSMAGMIAAIDSVLVGTFGGILLATLSWPLAAGTAVGVMGFLASIALHLRYQLRQWVLLERNLPSRFPSPAKR
jgi:hypothetical protein